MDVDLSSNRKCFKLDEKLVDNLNIIFNKYNNHIIFWNKYQIILYEDLNFINAKLISPEYSIQYLLLTNNYLICLDCSNNVHLTSLKFKKINQPYFKSSFQPRDIAVKAIGQISDDYYINLKYNENSYYFSLFKLNKNNLCSEMNFKLYSKEPFSIQNQPVTFFTIYHVMKEDILKCIQKIFNSNDNFNTGYSVIFLSFDSKIIYACLFNSNYNCEELQLVKLYVCPSEICNIEISDIDGLQLFIGLTIGTVVKLSLMHILEKEQEPYVIHLNTALSKFLLYDDNLIYTNNNSMWIADNVYSNNIKFKQIFVKNVKDFILIEDNIICTTFSKMIYKFSIKDKESFLNLEPNEEYCPAENILNNSEYLQKIIQEVEKNEKLVTRLRKEENYLTALALSNRQNLMDDVICTKVTVYEHYEHAIKGNSDLILTENISNYFEKNVTLFHISLSVSSIQHKLNRILENIFDTSRMHFTLSTEGKTIKSVSTKMNQLRNYRFLIPMKENCLRMNAIVVNIKIITDVPGSYNEKQNILTCIYNKSITLAFEHFVRLENKRNNIISLKKPKETFNELFFKTVEHQYGSLFEIVDIINSKELTHKSLYVKLPNNYEEILKQSSYCQENLNSQKSEFLIKQYTSQEFLKSINNIILKIGNYEVEIEIINFITNPLLKVSSTNYEVAKHLRNFFANILYDPKKYEKEYISNTFYTTVENLQKELKNCLTNGSEEDISSLMDQFEKNVIGSLPL